MPQYTDEQFVMEFELMSEMAFPLESYPICESGSNLRETIWSAVLNFLKKIQETMKKALQACKEKMKRGREDKKSKETIHKLRKLIQKEKNAGKVKVQFYNVWDYQKIVDKAVKELDHTINSFLRKYETLGAGLRKTDHFIDKVNRIIEKYDKQLEEIRVTKKEYPVNDILDWMDKEVLSGNDRVFSFLDAYMDKLNEYQKIVKDFDEKASRYAQETGMVRRPTELTEGLKNMSVFVKRNMDWIGPFMQTAGFIALRGVFKSYALEAETDAITGGKDLGDSLQGAVVSGKIAAENLANKAVRSKKAKGFAVAAGLSDVGSMATSIRMTENLYKATSSGRNSV